MTVHALRLHEDRKADTPVSAQPAVPPDPAMQAALIEAYWNEVEQRVFYLMELLDAGRNSEALTLCATYLEGVAHALVATGGEPGETFEDELEEQASDPFLTLVHPLQLVRVAAQLHGLSPSAVMGLAAIFPGPEFTLLTQGDALVSVRSTLSPADAALVERAIWKCTIAYVIYDFIRSQSFRRREGARTVGLGTAFHEGDSVQGLSVPELVSLLRGMIAEARARSLARGILPDGN